MSHTVVQSVNAFRMISPAPKELLTPSGNVMRVGESLNAYKSLNMSAFHSVTP